MERIKGMRVDEMLKAINRIEERIGSNLSNVQKILLTTDGSVTRILEILTKKPIIIETKIKTSIKADENLARELRIKPDEIVNYRVVHLKNPSDKALIFARSWTPMERLNEKIKKDLTSLDIPIGKILFKYKIETRREITSIDVINADDEMAKAFHVESGNPMLSRYYNIIHEARVLIRINEAFPLSSFH
ncbi:MAG: chorismate pyruvate-lyase family protein [Nitrososphaerales archaeon]